MKVQIYGWAKPNTPPPSVSPVNPEVGGTVLAGPLLARKEGSDRRCNGGTVSQRSRRGVRAGALWDENGGLWNAMQLERSANRSKWNKIQGMLIGGI